jgi:uncharacterized protein Yka (UPF0111/DUF47 family)
VVFNLMPKDLSFYDQLEALTQLVAPEVQRLGQLLNGINGDHLAAAKIEEERHRAHVLTRQILRALDQAFITPFDREDIYQLANDLYRVIDRVANTAERIVLYNMTEIHPSLQGQCKTLTSMVKELQTAIGQLRQGKGKTSERLALDELGRLEEESRRERARFLSSLYATSPDPLDVMKKREIHDLLMDAIGACDHLGRTIESVLLKNG